MLRSGSYLEVRGVIRAGLFIANMVHVGPGDDNGGDTSSCGERNGSESEEVHDD